MDTENASEESVEVEVVPQTVNEIVYLQEEEDLEVYEDQTSLFVPLGTFDEENDEDEEEIESVPIDTDVLPYLTVTLQESQTDEEFDGGNRTDSDTNLEEDIMLSESAVKCGINLYECKLCNKRFKSWKFVSTHVITHGEEWKVNQSKKEINCSQCRMTFDDPRSLTYHFQLHHDVPRSFVCDICSCTFISENGLSGHYKKHFHPKVFSCHICNAGYDSPIDMENHYKTHRTNLLYACNKCDAGFAGTVELSAHIRHSHPRIPTPKVVPVRPHQIYSPIFGSDGKITMKLETQEERETRLKQVIKEDNSILRIPAITTITTKCGLRNEAVECEETSKIVKKRRRSKKKAFKKNRKF